MDNSFASMLKTRNGRMRCNFSPFEMSKAIRNRIERISIGDEKDRLHKDISTILNTIGSNLWKSKAISIGIRPYTSETVSALLQEFTAHAILAELEFVGDRLALSDSFLTSADAAASNALIVDNPIVANRIMSALSEPQRSNLKLISGIDAKRFSIDGFAVSEESRATALIDLLPIFQVGGAPTKFCSIESMERHLKLFPDQAFHTVITDLFGIPRFGSKCKVSVIHDGNLSVGPRCKTAQLLLTRLIRVSQLFLKSEGIKGIGIAEKDVDEINRSKAMCVLTSSTFLSSNRLQQTIAFEDTGAGFNATTTTTVSDDVNMHAMMSSDESSISIIVKENDVPQEFLNLFAIQLVLRVMKLELSRVYSVRQVGDLCFKDFDISGLEKHLVKVSKLPSSRNFEEYLHAVFDDAYEAHEDSESKVISNEPSLPVPPVDVSEGWAGVAKLQEGVENRKKLQFDGKRPAKDAAGFTYSFGSGGGGGGGDTGDDDANSGGGGDTGGSGGGGGGSSGGGGGSSSGGGGGGGGGSSGSSGGGGSGIGVGSSGGEDVDDREYLRGGSSGTGGTSGDFGGAKMSAMSEIDDSTMEEITFTEQEALIKSLKESDESGEVPNFDGKNNTVTGLIGEKYALKFLRKWLSADPHNAIVRWVNETEEQGMPYDFEITFPSSGRVKMCEVKTRRSADGPVSQWAISINEGIPCESNLYSQTTLRFNFLCHGNHWNHFLFPNITAVAEALRERDSYFCLLISISSDGDIQRVETLGFIGGRHEVCTMINSCLNVCICSSSYAGLEKVLRSGHSHLVVQVGRT